MKNNLRAITSSFAALILLSGFLTVVKEPAKLYTLNIRNSADLKQFFAYGSDRIPFVSAHRGGPRKGFPENCIATFENTLSNTWALLEIDGHYTKDSAIVLMHDATLDRTSNGKGKVSDLTLAEIRKLKLKDTEGNLTGYGIPTLDEAIEWAKGKTILVLDQKDIPMAVRVQKIQQHAAQTSAMVIAYSLEDVKTCYSMDKNIMMEVMIPDAAAGEKFEATGVPWKNIVAFITHTQPKEASVYQYVHSKGAMCIIGSSRTIDKQFMEGINNRNRSSNNSTGAVATDTAMNRQYRELVSNGADIIEADLGIEAGKSLQALKPAKTSKAVFFNH